MIRESRFPLQHTESPKYYADDDFLHGFFTDLHLVGLIFLILFLIHYFCIQVASVIL